MITGTVLAVFLVPVFFVVVLGLADKLAAWRNPKISNPAKEA